MLIPVDDDSVPTVTVGTVLLIPHDRFICCLPAFTVLAFTTPFDLFDLLPRLRYDICYSR